MMPKIPGFIDFFYFFLLKWHALSSARQMLIQSESTSLSYQRVSLSHTGELAEDMYHRPLSRDPLSPPAFGSQYPT